MEYTLINPNRDENISPITQIFLNRGFKEPNIHQYLTLTDEAISAPTELDNIHEGAKLLFKHIKAGNDILIIYDSDADGYTSSALLLNYLHSLFPAFVENHISYLTHEGKQHGLNDCIHKIEPNIKLVILPDSSSNDYEEHKILHERGVDVLILDHHEAPRISEYAVTINNQLCDYPNKMLSGVGIVYQFCRYIDSLLQVNYADNFLDLVALGVISDMMDIRAPETRRLITKGLANIRNPFFYEMTQQNAFSIGSEVTPTGVAWYVTPFINAVTRTGTLAEKDLLFESMLDYKGYEKIASTKRGAHGQMEQRVIQAVRTCINVKKRQTVYRDDAVDFIKKIIDENNLLDNKLLIITVPKEAATNKGVTGLIANELMSEYQRPVLLLNEVWRDGVQYYEGSGRGYAKSCIQDFKAFLDSTGMPEYAEGHGNAFGFSILGSKLEAFIQQTNKTLKNVTFSTSYKVDFIYKPWEVREKDVLDIAALKPYWGQELEEALIALEHVEITAANIQLLGRGTMKVTLPNGISMIKFSAEDDYNELYTNSGKVIINAIVTCNKNEFRGNISGQFKLVDYEIIRKMEYDF